MTKYLPMDFAQFGNAKEAKIGDDNFAVLQENVFRFQVFMDDSSCV